MEILTAEQAAEAAKGLTFEKVWAALMELKVESQKRSEESQKQFDESQKRIEESQKKTEKIVADLSKNLGGIGNSLGRFTEEMFSSKLQEKFYALGYTFIEQSRNKKYHDINNRVIAETDTMLENGEYVALVEIKTELTNEDVDDHADRMEKIRKCFDLRNDGRKLIGAVAGGVVPENVLNYAQKKGFYVMVQNGDSVAIADMPTGFKVREW